MERLIRPFKVIYGSSYARKMISAEHHHKAYNLVILVGISPNAEAG